MSDFKCGDIIKRENGKNEFEVLAVRDKNNRYGDILILNLDTHHHYWDFSDGRGGRNRRRRPFILMTKEIVPKKIKNLTFDFKNGI
jgi:hypothetical protein